MPAVGLGRYKWYQSQTPGDVPARRLVPRRAVDTRQCASKNTRPRRGVDLVEVPARNECQQGCWAPKGGGL